MIIIERTELSPNYVDNTPIRFESILTKVVRKFYKEAAAVFLSIDQNKISLQMRDGNVVQIQSEEFFKTIRGLS